MSETKMTLEEWKRLQDAESEIDAHVPETHCGWCYQKITSNVHLCDCFVCGAPAHYCKHPRPKWEVQ